MFKQYYGNTYIIGYSNTFQRIFNNFEWFKRVSIKLYLIGLLLYLNFRLIPLNVLTVPYKIIKKNNSSDYKKNKLILYYSVFIHLLIISVGYWTPQHPTTLVILIQFDSSASFSNGSGRLHLLFTVLYLFLQLFIK